MIFSYSCDLCFNRRFEWKINTIEDTDSAMFGLSIPSIESYTIFSLTHNA